MSQVPADQRKPSVLIELLTWVVFIIPMVILWIAFQSWEMIAVILMLRIVIMGISHYGRLKKPAQQKPHGQPEQTVPQTTENNKQQSVLYPFIEEARAELHWVLQKLRMHNEREEENLNIYRRFRGWK